MNRNDARYGFFRPFYETRHGQIIGLATPKDPMRDGLAIALLARHFPLPEYEGISVEPSRPSVHPAENVFLVGSSPLFVKADAHPISGDVLPLCVGERKLGARLRRIDDACCFRFENGDGRKLVNDVTGQVWAPNGDPGTNFRQDYGVIRRVFRGPLENTLIVEGVHRLGTLGAAKVVTSPAALDAIWEAVLQLSAFDESRPLEILVRASFTDEAGHGVYSVDAVQAMPILAVYDRQWTFDLAGGRRWTDQMPWDVHVRMRGDEPPASVGPGADASERPRLEIEADLRHAEAAFRRHCVALFASLADGYGSIPFSTDPLLEAVLEGLAAELDRFRVLLVDDAPFSSSERQTELPQGQSRIRKVRKHFLVHLALCRLRGRRFRCEPAALRRYFPDFEGGASAKPFEKQFIGAVPGRMREGFEPLLGEAVRPKDHVRIDYERRQLDYALRLERASLVVRLRL